MYSCEERVLTFKLYLKRGRRSKAPISGLGYPTRNCLKAW
jgi:hypothetical protein